MKLCGVAASWLSNDRSNGAPAVELRSDVCQAMPDATMETFAPPAPPEAAGDPEGPADGSGAEASAEGAGAPEAPAEAAGAPDAPGAADGVLNSSDQQAGNGVAPGAGL